ncbi:uncharacterized protein LOC127571789 [Pristis pectinata]|uniref:uncharacterized protein LOC127571789 n=1 Tax=Pristis pectinata TaxID=685728 RepID=UPI00223DCE9D|nr:uncharacterized protein LOC127571789 [Pristis pectinata]
MKEMAIIPFAQQIFLAFSVFLWQNALGESPILWQYPATIEKNHGESATIFCNLSKERINENMNLVWYKYTWKDKNKLGEINLNTRNFTAIDQICLSWDDGNYTAKMSIQQLKANDSGMYGCELLSVAEGVEISKANATNITVTFTEGRLTVPEQRNSTNSTNNVTDFLQKGANIQIILATVIATFVIICLLIFILIRYRPKKQDPDASPPTANTNCQKQSDPISTVYSIDYAVLQVPEENIRQNLTTSVASDDSYYATIIFAPQ